MTRSADLRRKLSEDRRPWHARVSPAGAYVIFALAVVTGFYAIYFEQKWEHGIGLWVLALAALAFAGSPDRATEVKTPLFSFKFQGEDAQTRRFSEAGTESMPMAVEGNEDQALLTFAAAEENDAGTAR